MNKLIQTLIVAIFLSLPFAAFADPGNGNGNGWGWGNGNGNGNGWGNGNNNNNNNNGNNVPLDGGLSLLAAAGIAYGSKKFLKEKRRK